MDTATQPVIEFEWSSLTYPENDAPALQSIDLRIRSGERVLLLGPSGCGKSSHLNMMLGLVPGSTFARTEGVARVFGDHAGELEGMGVWVPTAYRRSSRRHESRGTHPVQPQPRPEAPFECRHHARGRSTAYRL